MWRVLRRVLVVVVGLVAIVAIAVALLILTNPDPRERDGWARHADMPSPRGEVASASTGGRLYVMGGLRGLGGASRAVTVYRPADDAWARGPDLPAARHHAAAAAIGGDVYLAGGATGTTSWTAHADVWVLRAGGADWEAIAPMPEGRYGHQLVALDGRLYVLGGDGGGDDVLVHEPGAGWARRTPIPEGRDHLAAVALGGEIWAIGGRADDVLTRVDVYDPARDRWRAGPDLPVPMSAMAAAVLDGAIHVAGGERPSLFGGKVIDRHYVLAVGATSWEELPAPLMPVHGAAAGAGGGRLLVAGGSRRQGALSVLGWTGITQSFDPAALARDVTAGSDG